MNLAWAKWTWVICEVRERRRGYERKDMRRRDEFDSIPVLKFSTKPVLLARENMVPAKRSKSVGVLNVQRSDVSVRTSLNTRYILPIPFATTPSFSRVSSSICLPNNNPLRHPSRAMRRIGELAYIRINIPLFRFHNTYQFANKSE